MKQLAVNGVEIAYLDEGKGPAVVIGHCSSASHKEWLPLIEMLWRQAGPFVALTPKMPGVKWTAEFHDQIPEALKDRDAGAVKQAIEQDVDGTTQELLRNAEFV